MELSEGDVLFQPSVPEGVVVGVAVARAETLGLNRLSPVNAIRREAPARRAEADVVEHLVMPGGVELVPVLEDADVGRVTGDDVGRLVTAEGMQPQRRL